jgi:hypothetical protein
MHVIQHIVAKSSLIESQENAVVEQFVMPRSAGLPSETHISFVGGTFLHDEGQDTEGNPLPEACVYGLSRILHDWDDATCSKILARLRRSVCPHGGILIVDAILPNDKHAADPRKYAVCVRDTAVLYVEILHALCLRVQASKWRR